LSENAEALAGRAQERALALYRATTILMLLVIAGLIVYAIRLGPLVGPGVEQSFGLAVAIMFLAAALIVHLVDRTYRVWPAGRRVQVPVPGTVSDRGIALAVKVAIFAAVGAGIAYVIATLVM
jgi:hypothetical protein